MFPQNPPGKSMMEPTHVVVDRVPGGGRPWRHTFAVRVFERPEREHETPWSEIEVYASVEEGRRALLAYLRITFPEAGRPEERRDGSFLVRDVIAGEPVGFRAYQQVRVTNAG